MRCCIVNMPASRRDLLVASPSSGISPFQSSRLGCEFVPNLQCSMQSTSGYAGKKVLDTPVDAGWCWGRHRTLRTEFRLFYVKFLGVFQCIVLE